MKKESCVTCVSSDLNILVKNYRQFSGRKGRKKRRSESPGRNALSAYVQTVDGGAWKLDVRRWGGRPLAVEGKGCSG